MSIMWKSFRVEGPKWLKKAAFAVAGLAALYIGAIQPMLRARLSSEQNATGLAWTQQQSWHGRTFDQVIASREGIIGGAAESMPAPPPVQGASLSAAIPAPASQIASWQNDNEGRKMTRTDSLDLVVQRPADSAEQIRALAEHLGGYLETSQVSGDQDSPSASLTVRVPAARFEEARMAIRKLGLRVESERVEAQDVTKQYVDQDAQLRNLRAEETQYLGILKHASTVSDTLEVSEKLNEVRGQIEQQQAEFDALSRQIETVAITVTLGVEADTQVFGLRWRPLYQLKIAARNGLNGLGDYASIMASVIFCLPAILLWMATILVGLAVAYRILRWARRLLFARRNSAVAQNSPN